MRVSSLPAGAIALLIARPAAAQTGFDVTTDIGNITVNGTGVLRTRSSGPARESSPHVPRRHLAGAAAG